MLFPLKIALFSREITLFYTNFNYKLLKQSRGSLVLSCFCPKLDNLQLKFVQNNAISLENSAIFKGNSIILHKF